MDIRVDTPNQQELVTQAQGILAIAMEYKIDSVDMYQMAASELQTIKGRAKALDEKRKSITKPIDEAKTAVMDMFRQPLAILTEAEGVIKRALLTYDQEQEALRKAEEDRLREIARKEREALEAKAKEAERAAAEKAAALKKQAEEAAAAGNVAEAAKLEAKAETVTAKAEDRASALTMQAHAIAAPTVVREVPKVAGLSKQTVWHARVEDASLVPREYLVVNEKLLDGVAKSTKGAIKVPGVTFYAEIIAKSSAR